MQDNSLRPAAAVFAGVMLMSTITAEAHWERVEDMPTARQELYVAVHDGMIYVPGGILADGAAFTDAFERYDPARDAWETLAPMPAARHHITPAVVGDKLYAIGGFEGEFPEWRMRGETFVYDLQAGAWSEGVPLPSPQAEHVQAVVNGRIHIIGGREPGHEGADHFDEHDDTNRHLVFDPTTGRWSGRQPAPTARNSAAAAVIDGRIYVVGGRKNVEQPDGSQLQHNLTALEVYHPETDSWEMRAPMPQAQGGLAAAAVDGKLYVFGGEQWTPEQKVFGASWVYDPGTDNWHALPELPTPRHGLAAAAAGGRIFVIGGCTVVGGGAAVATVEALTP